MKKIALIKDITKLWTVYKPALEKHNIDVITLDIFNHKDRQVLLEGKWDAFIWRAKHDPLIRNLAKRFIYLFDKELGVKTFPSWDSYWLYDDKIAQYYLMRQKNVRTPKTNIFFNLDEAMQFLSTAEYPLVYKCPSGAGSANVGFLKNRAKAERYATKAIRKGVKTYFKEDFQKGYVYFQEYLRNNTGDYRLVCHKNKRIDGYFRDANKEGFASGSGKYNFDDMPEELLLFVADAHQKLGNKLVMSYDVLKNNEVEWVVTEMSVVFGDLDSWSGDTPIPNYTINPDSTFSKVQNKENDHIFFINFLLKEWGFI